MPVKIYLAGAIDNEWRDHVVRNCKGAEWLSPIDGLRGAYDNADKMFACSSEHPAFHIADIMKIDEADIIFAYFQEGSKSVFSGTSWECGYAYASGRTRGKQKHIIVVNDLIGREYLYEIVRRFATIYCDSLNMGCTVLRSVIKEMNYKVGQRRGR